MIRSKIIPGGRTTIPIEVRLALGLGAGDQIQYEINDGHVILSRLPEYLGENSYSCFVEWFSDADSKAFGAL